MKNFFCDPPTFSLHATPPLRYGPSGDFAPLLWSFFIHDLIGFVDFEILPLPIITETGKRPHPFADTKGFGIYKDSTKKDAAIEFINYVTDPENIQEFCLELTKVPTVKSKYLNQTAIANNPIMNALVEQAKSVQDPPKDPISGSALEYLNAALDDIVNNNAPIQDRLDEVLRGSFKISAR